MAEAPMQRRPNVQAVNPALLANYAKFGPGAAQNMASAQRFADMLQGIQESGLNNSRTPLALGANLLADAVAEWGLSRANKQAVQAYQAQQANENNWLRSGTPVDTTPVGANADAPNNVPSGHGAESNIGAILSTPAPSVQLPSLAAAVAASGGGSMDYAPSAANQALVNAIAGSQGAAPDAPRATTGDAGPSRSVQLASAMMPPPQSAPQAQPAQPQADPQVTTDQDALARMMLGEAGNQGDRGMAAVGQVAINRLHSGGYGATLSDVVRAPHQFPGVNTANANIPQDSPLYQHALAVARDVQNGAIPDETGGAVNYLNPTLMARMGKPLPAWAQGNGQMIGAHEFFGGHPQQIAQQGAQRPTAVPQGVAAEPADFTPANGPQGGQVMPASMPMGGPMPPQGAQTQPMAAGQFVPQPQQFQPGPAPHQQVTQQEWQEANRLLSNPATRDLGVQEMLKLRMRAASAVAAPKDMAWDDSQGRFVPLPGTGYSQPFAMSPRAVGQYDPFGKFGATDVPGRAGEAPAGAMWDPNTQSYVPIRGGQDRPLTDPRERAAYGINPGDRGAYTISPQGKVTASAQDPFGPERQMAYAQAFMGAAPYKDYVQLRQFHDAAMEAMKQQGGPADLQILDMALKSNNPTLGIRPNQVEQMMEEIGLPNRFKGELQALVQNGQALSPAARQAMVNVIDNQMTASWKQLQPLVNKADRDAQRYGLTREDLIPGLIEPAAPGSAGRGFGPAVPQAPPNASAAIAQARQAIAAGADRAKVIQRLQANGINPAGL